jgi:hypothetical protein
LLTDKLFEDLTLLQIRLFDMGVTNDNSGAYLADLDESKRIIEKAKE